MGSQQLYSLSWGEFGSSFASTVQVLRGQHEMVDVTLTAGGRIFPAHKLVLSAASPLLMELLKSTHCHHPVLMLAGITAPDLEALLQFVYQGEVSVVPSQLPSLLQAAHCLNIQALSPQTITAEKTMTQISVPVVMTEPTRDINSPLPPSPQLPVRKRKRRQHRDSDSDAVKWAVVDEVGLMGDVRPGSGQLDNHQVNMMEAMAHAQAGNSVKDEIMEEHQNCHEEQPEAKRLVSDLPIECTVCGVTLRQSRNLKRHMELIHLKVDSGKQRKNPHMKDDKSEEGMIQTLTELSPLDPGVMEQNTRPPSMTLPTQQHASTSTQHLVTTSSSSQLMSPPPHLPPVSSHHTPAPSSQAQLVMTSSQLAPTTSQLASHILTSPPPYHSSTQCDPYSHTQTQAHTQTQHSHMQFTHGNDPSGFRQHQSELLRSAGIYTDAREHCTTE